jgi:hypothetical protein
MLVRKITAEGTIKAKSLDAWKAANRVAWSKRKMLGLKNRGDERRTGMKPKDAALESDDLDRQQAVQIMRGKNKVFAAARRRDNLTISRTGRIGFAGKPIALAN